MNKFLQGICLAAGVLAVALTPVPAAAQGPSANLSVTNNYVWRGITQNDDKFAVQGGADYDFGNGLAVGTWASMVDFNDAGPTGGDTKFEIDFYGSYSGAITEMVSYNVGGIGYFYPDAASGTDYDFFEAWAGLEFDADAATFSTTVYFGPDVGGLTTFYYTGGVAVPVAENFELSANIGYYDWETGGVDSTDWNIGGTFSYEQFSLSLMYTGVEFNGGGSADNIVASLTISLP